MTHICVGKLTIIGSDNGLSPERHQAIIWTNAGILSIRTLGTNFSEILSEIHKFSFTKIHFKMSSGKWRPSCLGLNVLTCHQIYCGINFCHIDKECATECSCNACPVTEKHEGISLLPWLCNVYFIPPIAPNASYSVTAGDWCLYDLQTPLDETEIDKFHGE